MEIATWESRSPSGQVVLLGVTTTLFREAPLSEADASAYDAWLSGVFDRFQARRGAAAGTRLILHQGKTTLAVIGLSDSAFANPTTSELARQVVRIPARPELCNGHAPRP